MTCFYIWAIGIQFFDFRDGKAYIFPTRLGYTTVWTLMTKIADKCKLFRILPRVLFQVICWHSSLIPTSHLAKGWINTLRPRRNWRHIADDIFLCIFLKENNRIPIQKLLKYVLGGPIDNKPAPVQIMAWRRTGDKPLPEPMLTQFVDAYMQH